MRIGLRYSCPFPGGRGVVDSAALRGWTLAILAILVFQLLYGALMAGHRAANVAPTWPDINGSWMPASLFSSHPLLHDLVGNRLTVQWIHRNLAYCLFCLCYNLDHFRLPAFRGSCFLL